MGLFDNGHSMRTPLVCAQKATENTYYYGTGEK